LVTDQSHKAQAEMRHNSWTDIRPVSKLASNVSNSGRGHKTTAASPAKLSYKNAP